MRHFVDFSRICRLFVDVTSTIARRHGLETFQMNVAEISEMLFDIGNTSIAENANIRRNFN